MLINLEKIGRIKKGKTILNDIDWTINEGDRWVLYGLNGAGKTTLLNIINAYESPTRGHMTLFGMQPGKVGYSADNVRNHIGFVSNSLMERFQEGELVKDVVMSGAYKSIGLYTEPSEEVRENALNLLKQVGMEDFKEQYYGLLSTGERQRVLIARALMGQPDLLVLDEPVSGLDFLAREAVLSALDNLYHHYPDLAVIYVTHFVEELTSEVGKGFLLKDGECYKQGAIETVLNSDTLSAFFNRPVELTRLHGRYALFLKS